MQVLHENFGYISSLIYGKWKTVILMLLFSVNVLCWEPSTPCRRISLISYGFRENHDRWRPKVLISKILLVWHPILISVFWEMFICMGRGKGNNLSFSKWLYRDQNLRNSSYLKGTVFLNNLHFSCNFDPLSW